MEVSKCCNRVTTVERMREQERSNAYRMFNYHKYLQHNPSSAGARIFWVFKYRDWYTDDTNLPTLELVQPQNYKFTSSP